MNVFLRRLGGLGLVIGASFLVSLGGAYLILGTLDLTSVGAAHVVGLVVGVVALKLVHGADVSVNTMLAATGTRVAGACLAGGLLFLAVPGLQLNTYVISIAASYFAVLIYETRLLSLQLKSQLRVEKEDLAKDCSVMDGPAPSVG